jgi:hypothetical protein
MTEIKTLLHPFGASIVPRSNGETAASFSERIVS